MRKGENNYAFIDSQNLNLGVRSLGWKLDFGRFRVYLREKYGIAKAFLFIGYVPGNEQLYITLQDQGYLVVFKPTLLLPGGQVKGNVDAELVLHTMIEYPNYEKVVIITSDGDFHCLVEYLHEQDKLLALIVPNRFKYSSLLRGFMEHIVFMNNLEYKVGFR